MRIGGMATMPSRAHTLAFALERIMPQVDRLYLFLDQFTEIPETITQYPNITPLLSTLHGDFKACGKFLGMHIIAEPCLYFCFDDDILYPLNYVEIMARALRRHGFRAIVGVHAALFRSPHFSYSKDRIIIHFGAGLDRDCYVDELGTGTIAFYTGFFSFHPKSWEFHNMADLMVAIEAVRQGIPRVTIRRPKNFLTPLEENQKDSLYKKLTAGDIHQTRLMQSVLAEYPHDWHKWGWNDANHQASVDTQEKFQQALALHQKGQLVQAQVLYEEILKLQPEHSDALHLLGVIAAQTNNPQRAVQLIGKAIEINPNNAAAHHNRGIALGNLNQIQTAIESFDQAIALKPDYAEAYFNRGIALESLHKHQGALESFDRAIAIKPDYTEACNKRDKCIEQLKTLPN